MSLAEVKQIYMSEAARLPNYEDLNPTELGNGYCDADESGNQPLRSAYWAAVVLRYWPKIYKWKLNSTSLHLPDEEFVTWLEDALGGVFYYRSWRWEYKAIVKCGKFVSWKLDENGEKIPNPHYWKVDPNAVDRTINYFCSTQRGKVYQYVNKDLRKNDGQSLSIEGMVDDNGRQVDYIGSTKGTEIDGARELVSAFLKNNKPIEALVVDGVAYQDSFRNKKSIIRFKDEDSQGKLVTKRYIKQDEVFDIRRLLKHLNTIDEKFIKDYFCSNYLLSKDEGKEILSKVAEMSNEKWRRYVKKTMVEIKQNENLLSLLKNLM